MTSFGLKGPRVVTLPLAMSVSRYAIRKWNFFPMQPTYPRATMNLPNSTEFHRAIIFVTSDQNSQYF